MYLEVFFLFIVTFLAYHFFNSFAKRLKILDIPNYRSSHEVPIVRGFGAVILFSIGITLFIFKSFLIINYPNLLGAILLIGLLGFADDIRAVKPVVKIIILIFACILLIKEGFIISNLGVYLESELKLQLIAAIIFSVLSIVTFTNAFNLVDGLDGLAGLIAIIIFMSFLQVGLMNDDKFLITIPILFITSLVVFIIYNWHPAKIFLGDSGSLMIGFVISVIAIRSIDYIHPISILYIATVPILDFLFVTLYRTLNRSSIFMPDKNHCHHILLSYFDGNIKKTVISISIFQSIACFFGVLYVSNVSDGFLPLIFFGIMFVIIFKFLVIVKPINQMKNL